MDHHLASIHSRIRSTRRILWMLRTLNFSLISVSFFLLCLLMTAYCVIEGWRGLLPLKLLEMGAWGLMISPLVCGGVAAWYLRDLRGVAREMERRDSRINDALLTVLSAEEDASLGSAEVLAALRVQVSTLLANTSVNRWAPWGIMRRGVQCGTFVSLIWVIALLGQGHAFSKIYETLTSRPEQISQRLAYAPLIGDLKLTITPPKYTKAAPRFIEGGSGDFEALEGSEIQLQATLSRVTQSATIWLEREGASSSLDGVQLEGRSVRAQWVVDQDIKWNVSLIDREGTEWREATQRQIIARPDAPPRVQVISPESGSRVDPTQAIEVGLKVSDDYGISSTQILVALDSDMEHPEEIPLVLKDGRQWTSRERIDLSVIQAQGGDRIALWARAKDNREKAEGPQEATSEIVYLEIDSPQWQHRELLDALREHLEVQLEALAARLELDLSTPDNPLTVANLLSRWGGTRDKSIKARDEMNQLLERLSGDELTPREIYLALTNAHLKLEEALSSEAERLSGQLESEKTTPDQMQRRMMSESGRAEEAHEGLIILIEAMVARMALEEMAHLADELSAARTEIRQLIEQYRNQPSEALKSRIRRALQRFKQKMQAMREMMARLQKKIPKEFLNLDGMKSDEIESSLKESEAQVSSIEQLLEEGKIDEALNELEELSKALEEMSQQLKDDMDELHRQTNPELEQALSELMDQTRDLMKAQDELKRDTQAQQDAMDKAVEDQLREAKEKFKSLLKKVNRIDSLEKDLQLSRQGRYLERTREDVRKAIDDLERALSHEMVNEGIDAAERSVSGFESLHRFEKGSMYDRRSSNQQAQRPSVQQLQEAGALSDEVLRTLEDLKTKLSQAAQNARDQEAQQQELARSQSKQQGQSQQQGQPQPQGRPQSSGQGNPQGSGRDQAGQSGLSQGEQLARRQSKIGQRLQSLRDRLETKKQKIPALNQVPNEPFEAAQNGSQSAEQQLRRDRPGSGLDGQQQVSDSLKQVMEGLKQSKSPQQGQKPGQQSGSQGQGSGHQGASSTEKVEVPERGERGPDAMREALLDAMKSKPARGYDDQVKAYYESLVR